MFQEKVYTKVRDGGTEKGEYPEITTPDNPNWNARKRQAKSIVEAMANNGLLKYANAILNCSRFLEMLVSRLRSGEIVKKTYSTYRCKNRHCPVCAWIRTRKLSAEFEEKVLPAVQSKHKNSRWIFLTLTVPNCPVQELSKTLDAMNKAWRRFVLRKEFKPVQGWIRATEVTQEQKRRNYAHPHFHVLMMVRPDMFSGRNYVTKARWAEMWREVLGLEDVPIVHVQAVQNLKNGTKEIFKTFTYSIKADSVAEDSQWFGEYVAQVKKKRFLATGGVLKDLLKEEDAEPEEKIPEGEVDTTLIRFIYDEIKEFYRRTHRAEIAEATAHPLKVNKYEN